MDVQEFLQEQGKEFEVIPHPTAIPAQEVAAEDHVSGHKFAKTVIGQGQEDPYMFVLPASRKVDFEKASQVVGEEVSMATEQQMKEIFTDCDVGAEPPFGSKYGLPTYVESSLANQDEIVFRAGRHDLTVQMDYDDWAELEQPTVADFAIME